MSRKISFIGRANELNTIETLIKDWGTRQVLCIDGVGGIGKTRLLQEVRDLLVDQQKGCQVTKIIDFDDRALHLADNLERRIARQLDERVFETYLRRLLKWHKLRSTNVGLKTLKEERQQIQHAFAQNFNQLSSQKRIVILLDTTDKIEDEAWERLQDIILIAKNTVFLLAGRNAEKLHNELQILLGNDAQLMTIEPFEKNLGEKYLEEKQHTLNINLDPDLAQKLLVLARGRPILIDLAVEWLSRNHPTPWLTTGQWSEEELKQRQEDFETELVWHITQIRSPMDQLTLLMARVYPLNPKSIERLLNVSEKDANDLFERAQTFVFVKILPDGSISLHDEMRRMVKEHVWPILDPQEVRQRRDSKLAVGYLENEIKNALKDINRHIERQLQATEAGDSQAELNAFMTQQTAERTLWALREQLLFHTMFTDKEKGIKVFAQIFTEATESYNFPFRRKLLNQVQKYRGDLIPSQIYEVDIRQAKFLHDSGEHEKAKEVLDKILSRKDLQIEQRVDSLIQIANVEIRLGKFQNGIEFFDQAVQISRKHNLKEWLVKSLNGLGWAYRLTARLKQAGEYYEEALDLAIETNSIRQQALLYNNLGFLYTYFSHLPRHREQAVWFCEKSLALSQELGDPRGEGRSYSTLGCVIFMDGQFDEALSYFQKALDIFEPAQDREWLSTVYSWRGITYLSKRDIEQAEKDLLRSLSMNIEKDRPINLSRLGLIYIYQQDFDKAQEAVDECRQLSLDLPDIWYQLISLRDMARLAHYKREYDKIEEFEQQVENYLEKWGGTQDLRALGMFYLHLGSLTLGKGDIPKTIQHFSRGLRTVTELGRYGNDTPEVYIKRLETVMVKDLQLPPEQIREIGKELLSFWRKEKLDINHRDVRILLTGWSNWQGNV